MAMHSPPLRARGALVAFRAYGPYFVRVVPLLAVLADDHRADASRLAVTPECLSRAAQRAKGLFLVEEFRLRGHYDMLGHGLSPCFHYCGQTMSKRRDPTVDKSDLSSYTISQQER